MLGQLASKMASAWQAVSTRTAAAVELAAEPPPAVVNNYHIFFNGQIRENMGSIWISNTYRLGRLMDLAKYYYKFTRRERLFRAKLQKQIDDSFDDLQFPGQ
jgi:hypothetical protein